MQIAVRGKKPAQTQGEVVAFEQAKRSSNKFYKKEAQELADNRITALVGEKARELKKAMLAEHITLADAEKLRYRIGIYLDACTQAGSLPTVAGLARSCGLSRQAIYDYLSRNPETESGKLLQMFHDLCVESLSESSLRGDVQPVVSIFLLKASYGLRESVELIARNESNNLYGEQQSAEAIAEKYSDIVIDEFSDD